MANIRSASFGQYGFSDVMPGHYQLRVLIGWQEYTVPIEVSAGQDNVRILPIPVPADLIGLPDRRQDQASMRVAMS